MPPDRLVTFLFSDIEGSTRLWAEDEAMRTALVRHDEILAGAFTEGDLFKHTGDGVCVAFDSPGSALRAAAAAQRALDAEAWPTSRPIRVRIGINTGEAEHREGDYFGTSLSRTARLMDAAHGGQVVVSASTQALVGTAPDGITFHDLGEHRLKDLRQRERVFQLGMDGLTSDFPPLRSLESYATNLPVQLTPFVGRSAEVAEVLALLEESRLVTLTGVGGVGKTRLAIQVAAENLDRFPDGVWLTELAPITDATLLVRQIADAMGIREQAGRPIGDVLIEHMSDRVLLIALDNCEHVIDEAAKVVEWLLQSVTGLKVLATSREGLSIGAERLWQVPSMTRAGVGADAVSLFVDRARMVRPDFALDASSAETVAQLCDRLDGIPLAIELAAARLKVFTVQQIAERLDDRFRLLTGGSRTALPRQRTLEATMDWSYDLLTPSEQTLLRRLSVFYGGFSFDAAEEVCANDPLSRSEVLDLLSHLIETSLVIVDETVEGSRYALLETVRQYGLGRLIDAGEGEGARLRHAEFFATVADAVDEALLGPEASRWLVRIEADHDNARAALTWALEASRHDLLLGLACGMSRFWLYRSYLGEGAEWHAKALAKIPAEATEMYSESLQWAGMFEIHRGNFLDGQRLVRRGHEVAVAVGDPAGIARAENALGNAEAAGFDLSAAQAHYERALEAANPGYRSVVLVNLAMTLAWTGQTDRARAVASDTTGNDSWAMVVRGWIEEADGTVESAEHAYRAALERVASSGERLLEAWALYGLAETVRRRADLDEAVRLVMRADDIAREIGSGIADWAGAVVAGRVAVDRGDLDMARLSLARTVDATGRNRDHRGRAYASEVAARVASATGAHEAAARLVAASDRLLAEGHEQRRPHTQEEVETLLERARPVLGEEFAVVLEEGAALDFDAIGELILEV